VARPDHELAGAGVASGLERPRSGWHITDGGPILRHVIHEAGAYGVDVHIIARSEKPSAEALDSSAGKEP